MHPNELTIGDYVDEALSRDERDTVAAHLEHCDRCRTLADGLRALRGEIAGLELTDPPARVWTRIENELRASGSGASPARAAASTGATARRGAWQWRWLTAAAALVVAIVVGVGALRFARSNQPDTASNETVATAQSVEAELRLAEQHYQKAIGGLEQIANADKGALDPQTAATVQSNLAVVDQAISESRAALIQQPGSAPAQESLLENFKTKVRLLQDTVALINEMRKGNEAGAARIASGLKQKGS